MKELSGRGYIVGFKNPVLKYSDQTPELEGTQLA
jgi:hypothetical protein